VIGATASDSKEFAVTKQELEKKLAAHRHELRKMGVVSLAVFGSVARNESAPQSDIDLLVDFDRDVSLFHLFEIQHRLEEIIGVPKIDLIQKGAIHPALRKQILSEAVNVA
jgi:predicted nucleotidyltransferase